MNSIDTKLEVNVVNIIILALLSIINKNLKFKDV